MIPAARVDRSRSSTRSRQTPPANASGISRPNPKRTADRDRRRRCLRRDECSAGMIRIGQHASGDLADENPECATRAARIAEPWRVCQDSYRARAGPQTASTIRTITSSGSTSRMTIRHRIPRRPSPSPPIPPATSCSSGAISGTPTRRARRGREHDVAGDSQRAVRARSTAAARGRAARNARAPGCRWSATDRARR